MNLTEEQKKIIDKGVSLEANLVISARAGAAKTTTLVKMAEELPTTVTGLCLAFNTAIRDELKLRMPENFTTQTLNGCGYAAWRQYIGGKCKLDKDKNYNLLRLAIDKLDKPDADEIWDNFADIKRAISLAKTAGYIPLPLNSAFRPLLTADEFYNETLFFNPSENERALIDFVLAKSFEAARKGSVDFDDMLLGPAVAGVAFPVYDVVLVDEAQDLSAINHVMLKKLVKRNTKLYAVGDPCQAIYGFRGAHSSSMKNLGQMFDSEEFFLTTSFRCSKAVCENARWRAPDMNSPEWAPEGSVQALPVWDHSVIPDGAAIICRNNAPLFSVAIKLLRAGRYPELRGRDVVKTLVAKMKKLGKAKLTQAEALLSVEAWVSVESVKQRDLNLVRDQADCMKIFIEETDNLGDAIAFAQGLASQAGRIYLMTGHGSKGLEFDDVFFLDQFLLDIKKGQDNNVKYVIETRAKLNLTYINSADYVEAGDD